MILTSGSVNRPILTTVIFLIIIIIGVVSFSRLSIDLMPEITSPTISVSTVYANVGPQEMEELITRPLEEALSAVQGVEEITSSSTEGGSTIRVAFTWGYDLDVAANDIRDRIDRIMNHLPEDIDRPQIRKFDLSAFPIVTYGVSSPMNPLDLRQLLDDQVSYRIERIPGVAAATVSGGLNREIHVNLEAAKLKALGLSTDAIITALQSENINVPAGLYAQGNLNVLIRTQGEYRSLDEIMNTVVTMRGGSPIQIKDIANVEDSWQEITRTYRVNGKPALRIQVNKQSGANTVRVADAVNEEIAKINRDIPMIHIVPLVDTSVYIRQSISNVGNSALTGGILAVIIIFLFLRNFSSTAIISTAIPISIIATFGLIYFNGFTLNLMTFGGLALGIGMLLDCAIVVLENIYRHRESGEAMIPSVLVGTSEVWAPILASTLTTVVVFIPVVFIRGMSGIMFKQMAYVVTFSLLCSLIVSLTLVPMLASKFLRFTSAQHYRGESRLHRLYAFSEIAFKRVEQRYVMLLQWALGHRKSVLLSTLILFIVSVILVRFVGVELMPAADEGNVQVNLEMAVGTRIDVIDKATQTVENIIMKEVPELTSVSASAGGGYRSMGNHTAEVQIALVSMAHRNRSSEQIANDLRKKLSRIPGVTIRTRAGQGLYFLRMTTSATDNVSVEVRGYDLAIGQELAQQVNEIVSHVPGITDTRISRQEGSPEEDIRIDRQKAADLGLTVTKIGNALQTAVGGSPASYYRVEGKEYRILVRLSEVDRKELNDLLDLTVVNNRGEPVILRNVVNSDPSEGPAQIERKDQERIITISANFTGRDMGSIISDIRDKLRSVPVPKDFAIVFGGDYEEQQKAFRELIFGFVLAVLLVYLVMAGQFESFRDPFFVMFSIPMALIGVVVTLIMLGNPFSMQAFIGCIILAGIVVNNAILLVDYTNRLRRIHGYELMEAIKLSGSRRLRPILMTTLATVLGLLPLAFGMGEGGEAQAPLARVVIGGLLSSTFITLVLIPVIYSIFEQRLKPKTNVVESFNVKAARVHTVLRQGITLVCLCGIAALSPQLTMAADSGGNTFTGLADGERFDIALKDAIILALERNPTVTIQRLNPEIAKTYVAEQRDAYDPDISATVNQGKSKLQRFLGTQVTPVHLTSQSMSYTVGISEKLPTGTTLSANASMSGSLSSLYLDQFSGIMGVSITQSLLRGLRPAANLASLRKTSIDVEISEAELRGVAEQVVANVESAYWNLYLAAEEITIRQKSLELADQQLQESLERVAVGKLPEFELAAVHAEVASRNEALIDTQSRYEQARLQFLYMLNPTGASVWATTPIPVDKPFVPADTLDTVAVHEELGMKFRPDLMQARLNLKKGELDVVQTKNGLLPQLDLFMSMGRTTYALSFNKAIPDINSPFFNLSAGLTYSMPVVNRQARAQVRRAVKSREQMEMSLRNMERMVQWDVRSAYIEVLRSKQQIEATRVTRELQEKKLEAEQEKFRVGKSTNFLVLQVQRDFTESRLDEARSMVTYLNALVNLYLMEGTLLDRRGIESAGA